MTHSALELIGRAAQMGGVAKDLAAARMSTGRDSKAAAKERVLLRLRRMYGLPHKVAQLIALDNLGEGCDVARHDHRSQPLLSIREIRSILASELPGDALARIEEIDGDGQSASIGQVHRARLDDGRSVAIKVQYPGVRGAIEADIAAVGWLAKPFGDLRRDFSIDAYRTELREMLLSETDYVHEAETLDRFGDRLRTERAIDVPEPVRDLSTERVLVMTWVDGVAVDECREWSLEDRRALSETLLRFFLRSVFKWNEVYADTHPGNFRFSRRSDGPRVGVLDFGCTRRLEAVSVGAMREAISLVSRGEAANTSAARWVGLYHAMGFDADRIAPLGSKLGAASELLFEPFQARGPYDLRAWRLGTRFGALLGADRVAFRSAGAPWFLALIRAYYGLVQHLNTLDAPVAWGKIFEEIPGISLPVPGRFDEVVQEPTKLRVRVSDARRLVADITMKGSVAARLAEVVPDHVLAAIEERGIDITALSREAVESKFAPRRLFDAQYDDRAMQVWLE